MGKKILLLNPVMDKQWPALLSTTGIVRASGEIGRHARLRILCRKAWGFKSPLAHQPYKTWVLLGFQVVYWVLFDVLTLTPHRHLKAQNSPKLPPECQQNVNRDSAEFPYKSPLKQTRCTKWKKGGQPNSQPPHRTIRQRPIIGIDPSRHRDQPAEKGRHDVRPC